MERAFQSEIIFVKFFKQIHRNAKVVRINFIIKMEFAMKTLFFVITIQTSVILALMLFN